MAFRNLIIESPARIFLNRSQLCIETDRVHSVAVEDVCAILLENRQSSITTAALSYLGQCGCAVFVCDEKHLPCAVTLPFARHSRAPVVLESQLSASLPLKKRLWQAVVTAKVENQAECLRLNGKPDRADQLDALAARIRSGDPENIEATAAQQYFPALFGAGFTRAAENGTNAALNYGYAILRGCTARSLAVYGFLPAFGLHHANGLNAWNLADDLMEPFRPVADLLVSRMPQDEEGLTPEKKRALFNLLNLDILSGGKHHSVSYAIERLVQSLSKSFAERSVQLCLPKLLELAQHRYE